MKKVTSEIADLTRNIARVLKLAYKIDPRLVTMYYLTSAIGALAPIFSSLLFKIAVDRLVVETQTGVPSIPLIVVLVLAGFYFTQLMETIVYRGLNVNYYDYLLRNKFQSGLGSLYARKLSSLDLGHLENSEIQTLIAKVEPTYTWQIPDFVRNWNYVFRDLVGIISVTIAFIPFNIFIPLILFLIALPRVYLKLKHGNFVWSMFGGSAPEVKKLWYTSYLLTERDSIIETRIFQSQEALIKKYEDVQKELYEINKKPLDKYRLVLIILPIIETLVAFGLVLYLLPGFVAGAFTIGSITFIISTLGQLQNYASDATNHIGELYTHCLFTNPFFELLNLPKLIKEKKDSVSFNEEESPKIEFRNVSFTYPNGHEVLKNVSFVINPGESVALVGINGSGKSTIIKLICRFYDVTSGEILINGVNIKDLKLSNWYSHLGTLFQDFVQYNFTIRENILLGKPGLVDEQRMIEAAKQSGAYDFISKMPKKFDQMLGKRFDEGEELSGGQWQKLAIARAFYERAPVLIMDEPTSAIDSQSEFEIFQNLEKIYKDRTLILVSHRFSTVRNAHKIIVIDHGVVSEIGTHEELLKLNGQYAVMFNTQARGYN